MSDFQFAALILNMWGVGYSVARGDTWWLGSMTLLWLALAAGALI